MPVQQRPTFCGNHSVGISLRALPDTPDPVPFAPEIPYRHHNLSDASSNPSCSMLETIQKYR